MLDVKKRIVTDEEGQPVAVQVDYKDWLEIERRLKQSTLENTPETGEQPSLEELSKEIRSYWKGGDDLEFQRRIRAEWDRPWENSDE